MTFIEKFNALKKKYGKIDESKLSENFAVQIEMTDDDCGGIFYVAYMDSPFAFEPYDYYDNTVSIKVSSKVLESILSCKSDAMEEFLSGNLQVEGDVSHALMLVELMKKEPKKRISSKKTEKEIPEKKAVKKESTAKKAANKKMVAEKEKKNATKKTTKTATKESK